MKKLIAVDFDGVLHKYITSWTNACTISDAPVKGAIRWLKLLIEDERFDVAIFSSRNHQIGGVLAIKGWLTTFGLMSRHIKEIAFPTIKPPAHIIIDDRCFCFGGLWPSMAELDEFVPWNKVVRPTTVQSVIEKYAENVAGEKDLGDFDDDDLRSIVERCKALGLYIFKD